MLFTVSQMQLHKKKKLLKVLDLSEIIYIRINACLATTSLLMENIV